MMTAHDKTGTPPAESPSSGKGKPPVGAGADSGTDSGTDSWAGWQPVWQGAGDSPHEVQERHSPTRDVHVRLSATRRVQRSRQRMVDARLWNSMEDQQQAAAIEIAAAYEAMGRGIGFTVSDWTRVPSGRRGGAGHNIAESHARLINLYTSWVKVCHGENVSHAMIIDILCFNVALAVQDKDRRMRKGSARENLRRGLDLYAEMRGWQRRRK